MLRCREVMPSGILLRGIEQLTLSAIERLNLPFSFIKALIKIDEIFADAGDIEVLALNCCH